MDTDIVSTITSHGPGYISQALKDQEKVVGLQTDKPLKRAFMPFGGIRMAEEACTTYGYTPDPVLHKFFSEYHTTHNQGVFDTYTPEIKRPGTARSSPGCRTHMEGDALWGTTAGWRSTASTF